MSDRHKGERVVIHYERLDELVRLTFKNVDTRELRQVLVGIWARLDSDDRRDHILELVHYQTDDKSYLSGIATAVRSNAGEDGVINVAELMGKGENVRHV